MEEREKCCEEQKSWRKWWKREERKSEREGGGRGENLDGKDLGKIAGETPQE